MKKLFSVMLVLALCGFASAVVNIYITDTTGASEIMVGTSDTIELLVWYTGESEIEGGGDIQTFDFSVTANGPGTILGGAITATARDIAYDMIFQPARDEVADIEIMGGRDDNGAVLAGLGNPLATVSYHQDGMGDVLIGLADVYTFDQQWNLIVPVYHGMIIHDVPEPATLSLLTLGGLALLRRRKK
jgi:hypothetical protein